MPQASVAEVVGALRPRYLRAGRSDKTKILDEFVALTGYHRKAAIRVLRNGRRPKGRNRRGRPRVYTPDVKAALLQVWEVCGRICSKRLAPFLPEIVSVLEREGELALAPDTRRLLVQLSPATIDRMLVTHRYRRDTGRPAAKPGTLLKAKVPVRTFADWEGVVPGFVELDLVAHCGETTAREYLDTLNAVDVATLWCEPVAVVNRSQEAVRKLIAKERVGSKVRRRYDRAQTPYRRVLAASDVPKERKIEVEEIFNTLNPAVLQRRIEDNLRALVQLPR
ncbi:hypothetical protein H5T55_06500 [Candidatus Bipolaricaulota bacterium]|nr:hypothetical protein [Candidatus Bipolaricaulota bacterium]